MLKMIPESQEDELLLLGKKIGNTISLENDKMRDEASILVFKCNQEGEKIFALFPKLFQSSIIQLT